MDTSTFVQNTMRMRRLVFCFLSIACFLSSFTFAQKKSAPKVKTWEEQVLGDWVVDSLVMYENGKTVPNPGFFEKANSAKLRFLPNGKVFFTADDKIVVSDYDLLSGSSGKYIMMDISASICVHLEKISDGELKAYLKVDYLATDGGIFVYLSRSTFPQEDIITSLQGAYIQTAHFSYYRLLNGLSGNNYEEELPKDTRLVLGQEGAMGNYLGNTNDTGTWSLNPKDYTIVLKGRQSTQIFEIVAWDIRNKLVLHQMGTPKDSLIRLEQVSQMSSYRGHDGTSIYEDSLAYADTVAVAAPAEEEDLRSLDQAKLCKSWKAVTSLKNFEDFLGDSLIETIRLNLLEDGTFTFIEGKKKHNGQWKRIRGQKAIELTIKGAEQLALYDFRINLSPDGNLMRDADLDYYDMDEDMNLVLSFMPPKSKTIRTYIFQRQR